MDLLQKEEPNLETCSFCKLAAKKYTCPRCNMDYCSLICYRCASHTNCAESFYENCVVEELSLMTADEQCKEKTAKLLNTVYNCGAVDFQENNNENGIVDSDDGGDDDDLTLSKRLAGIDLDDTSKVWEKLTIDERQEFEAFLRSDEVSKLVPKWEPWWLQHCNEIQDMEKAADYKQRCPKIKENIKPFNSITKKASDKCVQHNLVNIICSYVFTARYFNGDHCDFLEEAVACIIFLSLCLKENMNFENTNAAVESVHKESMRGDWITVDTENINFMKEDVKLLLKGPEESNKKYYILCALSEVHNLIRLCIKRENSQGSNLFLKRNQMCDLSKVKLKLCLKKIEYFLSYVMYFVNQ